MCIQTRRVCAMAHAFPLSLFIASVLKVLVQALNTYYCNILHETNLNYYTCFSNEETVKICGLNCNANLIPL